MSPMALVYWKPAVLSSIYLLLAKFTSHDIIAHHVIFSFVSWFQFSRWPLKNKEDNMRSKSLVSVLCVLTVFVLMGSQGNLNL
jgi:hypothetical protein